MTSIFTLRPLLAGAMALGFANGAFALDGADVLAKINGVKQMERDRLEASAISVDGDDILLSGVRLFTSGSAEPPIPMGDLKLENVLQTADGYQIENVSFEDVDVVEGGSRFTMKDFRIARLFVPNESKPGTLSSMFMFDRFSIGPMAISEGGQRIFAADGFEINFATKDDNTTIDYDLDLSGIHIDMMAIPSLEVRQTLVALGLHSLKGRFTTTGSWTFEQGRFAADFGLDVEQVGKLAATMTIDGYTLASNDAMYAAIADAEVNPDKQAGRQMMQDASMRVFEKTIFESASIRFDDAGITARALDYAGRQQGIDGPQMAQSLKAMLPMMLASMNMPELQKQIEGAVNAYLDNPKSIMVSAKPDQPLPAPQVLAAAMGDPANLVKTLNVTVIAND